MGRNINVSSVNFLLCPEANLLGYFGSFRVSGGQQLRCDQHGTQTLEICLTIVSHLHGSKGISPLHLRYILMILMGNTMSTPRLAGQVCQITCSQASGGPPSPSKVIFTIICCGTWCRQLWSHFWVQTCRSDLRKI